MELIVPGTVVKSFDLATSTIGNGTAFALPARASLVTWQHYWTGAPGSVTVQIQLSTDNSNWATGDSDTTVSGTIKVFETSAAFIRARINAVVGGTTPTVEILCKPIA